MLCHIIQMDFVESHSDETVLKCVLEGPIETWVLCTFSCGKIS